MSKLVITNIQQKDKGALKIICDVGVPAWGLTFREVKLFEKGDNNWLSMPTRNWEEADGMKYKNLVIWDDIEDLQKFNVAVRDAVDKKLLEDPQEFSPKEGDVPW